MVSHNDPAWRQKQKKREYDRQRGVERAAFEKAARHAAKPHLAMKQNVREAAEQRKDGAKHVAKKHAVSHNDPDWWQKKKRREYDRQRGTKRAVQEKAARHAAKPHLAINEKVREAAKRSLAMANKHAVNEHSAASGIEGHAASRLLAMMQHA